uniref:YadA-like family protein n=1 Tax=Acinetobacter bereziniae TaxID=106648 RepID=UPI0012502739|nr:YadA-like family protein [Acinetobacter bereziniae]
MNKTYKVVWNESLGTWCAISETSKVRGKRSTGKAVVAGAILAVSALTVSGMSFAANPDHYISVNDGGTQSGNYDNDGAKGQNSVAVGVDAVTGTVGNDIAIGSGAQAMGGRAVVIGLNAGSGNVSDGDANVLIGMNAGANNDGRWNTAIGSNSGFNIKGERNTALGDYAGRDVTGSGNIGLGASAGVSVTGETNLAVGISAGGTVKGDHNVALGRTAGDDVIGTGNVATGLDSGSIVRGSVNVSYGQGSGRSVTGDRNTAMGLNAGNGVSGNDNVAMAWGAGYEVAGRGNLALGALTGRTVNGNDNIAIGSQSGTKVNGSRNIALGVQSGQDLDNVNDATSLGSSAKANADNAIAIGKGANASATSSIALGSGSTATLKGGVAIGDGAYSGGKNSGGSIVIGGAIDQSDYAPALNGARNDESAQASIVIGSGASNKGAIATVIGTGASAGVEGGSTVIGSFASSTTTGTAIGGSAKVIGRNGTAVGLEAVAYNDGVALGTLSVANRNAGTLGYDPSSKSIAVTGSHIASLSGIMSAVSIGDTDKKIYRQITNVAAGTVDTDAVNVAQLKAVQAATETHYVSVNDGGVQSSNYNNDGAIGLNSIAVGANAQAIQENAVSVGAGAQSGLKSVSIGDSTGSVKAEGSIAIGNSGNQSVTGAPGFGTGSLSEGFDLIAIGTQSGINVKGNENIALGATVGNNVVGIRNAVMGGSLSGSNVTGNENIVLGSNAGNNITANRTLSLGSNSRASADDAIAIGTGAQSESYKGLAIGVGATVAAGGNDSIAIGSGAQAAAGRAVVIGLNAGVGNINDGDANVLIGMNAGQNNDGRWNTAVGSNSGYNTKGQRNTALGDDSGHDVTGNGNIGLGGSAGNSVIGETNLAVGASAGGSVVGSHNTALGRTAGVNVTGDLNTATGLDSGSTVLGNDNVAYGRGSGNQIKGDSNTAVGGGSGYQVSGNYNATLAYGAGAYVTGNANTALGFVAGNKVNGDSNIAIGGEAGSRVNGSRNVALGLQAGQDLDNVNDATSLGSGAKAAVTGSVALGSGSQAIRNVGNETAYLPVGTTIAGANAVGGEVSVGTIGRERRMTNVAAASQDTDAVNLSQLKAAQAAATTHYLSVNDDGTQGGNYNNDGAIGKNSIAIGVASKAENENSVALGTNAVSNYGGIAIGSGVKASNGGSTVIGSNSVALANNAHVIGTNNRSEQQNSSILGNENQILTSSGTSLAIGNNNILTSGGAATLGFGNQVSGASTLALGTGNNVTNMNTTAVGIGNQISGNGSIALGTDNTVQSDSSGILGRYNQVNKGSVAYVLGQANNVSGSSSAIVGISNIVANNNTFVLGNQVTTTQDNSVILGNKSTDRAATSESKVSINGQDYAFAGVGSANNGVVSVGKAGAERQIINVAAGKVSNDSTDAVNGSQLYATNQAITEVGKSAAAAKTEVVEGDNIIVTETQGKNGQSVYNVATAKEVSFNKTTVGTVITDSATGKITGLTAGEVSATSTDAINGSQLYATNQAIADSKTHYVSVNDDGVQADNYNNDGATGKNALAVGVGSKAAGENAVVIGYNNNVAQDKTVALGSSITTTQANSVVLGNESTDRVATSESKVSINGQDYAFAGVGSASNGVVSVGKVGGERQIINVAAGKVSSNSTDAVNGSQLYATNQAITEVGKSAAAAKTEVVEGDNIVVTETQGKNGQSVYNVATAKEVSFNKTTVGTVITDSATGKITGLTAGEVNATSTDAINGSQLYATNKAIADSKTHYVSVNDDGVQADNYNNDGAIGKNALAVGVGSEAAGENAVVIGYNNNVVQDKTVALGSSITTTQANSVVLGNESTDRAATSESKVTILGQDYAFAGVGSASNGVVSVGKVGGERQIINVAAGQLSATSTDAVNGSQLYATNQAISSLQGQVSGAKSTVTEGKNTTVTKTTHADGSTDYQVATKDDVSFDSVTVGNIKADAQSNKISGLADGEVSATSNEAVNGSQLHGTAESVANVLGGNAKVNADGTVSTSNIGNTGKDNVHDAIASLQGQVAGSKTSVSAGKNTVVNSSTNADGSNNYQVALADDINLNSVIANQVTANQVKADQVIANQVMANQVNVGKVTIDGTSNKVSGLANGTISKDSTDAINGSQLHQTNSNVAQYLGGGSTLNQDGSIKAPTYNVAGGTYHNVGDALGAVDTRVSNLEQAFYNTNKNVDDLRNDTYAGISGAMAVGNLPQPTEAGMSMLSAGLSGYRGETAVAVGISAISDSNKIIWKMGASADSRSNIGGAVSVGYQWK